MGLLARSIGYVKAKRSPNTRFHFSNYSLVSIPSFASSRSAKRCLQATTCEVEATLSGVGPLVSTRFLEEASGGATAARAVRQRPSELWARLLRGSEGVAS